MLHTEPSFCIYNNEDVVEEVVKANQENDEGLVRSVTIGDDISVVENNDFSFEKGAMGLIKEDENEEIERVLEGFNELVIEESGKIISPMYLASGFGVDGVSNGGVEFANLEFDEDGDVEGYYKSVLENDPSNPLFLRKYAQLLQSKGDLSGAEPYYFQATLADPKDGDTLSDYAKLVWELHRDKDKASDYFERAAHAAPGNSNVLAAHANFLWEINDEDSEDEMTAQTDLTKVEITEEAAASRSHKEDVSDVDVNSEEYYMKMIAENPSDPSLLRKYAQFLSQSKGDLLGAEEYYSRAIQADPTDGETISQCAILAWQLHRDKYTASSYFKKAVQASPENSDVLAAYARFLWEIEEDEDDEDEDEMIVDSNSAPFHQGVAAANS